MVACGGIPGMGGSDGPSAYEQLEGYPAALDKEIAKVMSPVDSVDAITAQMDAMPQKLGLSKKDFGMLLKAKIAGKPFVAPGGVDAKGQAELKTFLDEFGTMHDGITNAPANAEALVGYLGDSLLNVPKWVATVKAEAMITSKNPLASGKDKAKAAKEEKNATVLSAMILAKLASEKGRVADMPVKAASASAKFAKSMAAMGIESGAAAGDAGKDKATGK